MEREKLVGLAKVLVVAIVIIIIAVFVIIPKFQSGEITIGEKDEGISTEVFSLHFTFNFLLNS